MKTRITGTVTNGKFISDKLSLRDAIKSLEGKKVEIIIGKKGHTRSLKENDYYWGVVVKMIAEETGEDPKQTHLALMNMYNAEMKPCGLLMPRSSTQLTTVQWEDMCTKIRMWASEYLGIIIPLPNEAGH